MTGCTRRVELVLMLWLSVALGLLMGCSEERRGSLQIEVAAASAADCARDDRGRLPAERCASIRVCQRAPTGECLPLALIRSDGDISTPQSELRFLNESVLNFDVMTVRPATVDLDLTVFDGAGTPLAGASVTDVRFGDDPIRLRLHPFERWACAGPHAEPDVSAIAPRAFHSSVVLSNGDVLIFGGVQGERISASGLSGRATAQPAVEVYDADEHRFRSVEVDEGGFVRVLHEARYLGALLESPDEHRIRVYGGYSLSELGSASALLRFDSTGSSPGNDAAMPLLPGQDVILAPTVDLIYHAVDHALRVVSVDDDVRGALTSLVLHPDGRGVLMHAYDGMLTNADHPPLSGRLIPLQVDGATGEAWALNTPRLGASVSRLSNMEVLVWGGNVSSMSSVEAVMNAAEVVDASGTVRTLDSTMLPEPTGLHSADVLTEMASGGTGAEDPEWTILAGGLPLCASRNPGCEGLTVAAPDAALFALREMGESLERVTIANEEAYEPTIFHASVRDDAGTRLWLIGGATRADAGGVPSTLWSSAQVGVVRVGEGALRYEALGSLARARFGHAAARLPDGRLLVSGGFERVDASVVSALSSAEVLWTADTPPALMDGQCVDQALTGGADSIAP